MIILATGHQDRCIIWEQVAIFNKGVGFFSGLQLFALNKFVHNTYTQVYASCCKYAKINAVKGVPMNDYEVLNI